MIRDITADDTFNDHLVIFAWDDKLLKVLHYIIEMKERCGITRDILIVAAEDNAVSWDGIDAEISRLTGDPTDENVLKRAAIGSSCNVIILGDERNSELADARSILIVLAIKSISRNVHVCVEVMDVDNIASLRMARADHIISIPNLREKLLAQSSLTHYVSHIYSELFDLEREQSIITISFRESFRGKSISELSRTLYEKDMVLIGIWDSKTEKVLLNPRRSYIVQENDNLIILVNMNTLDHTLASNLTCG
ncbi:MAG: NAD-binding protein [Vulcanimicrobiota bacterium]